MHYPQRIAVWGLGLAVFSALTVLGAIQQNSKPQVAVPPEPPLEQVLELDADERMAFFNQRIALHCNVCHSSEMIEQQRLTLTQWQAEVQKMIGWGATLPKPYAGLMAEHLSRLYSPEGKPNPQFIKPEEALAVALQPDQELVDSKLASSPQVAERYRSQCASCHGQGGEGNEIGPRLTGRQMLSSPDSFARHIQQGRGRMPAFQQTMTSAEIQSLRRWLLGQSFSWKIK